MYAAIIKIARPIILKVPMLSLRNIRHKRSETPTPKRIKTSSKITAPFLTAISQLIMKKAVANPERKEAKKKNGVSEPKMDADCESAITTPTKQQISILIKFVRAASL